MYTCMYVHVYVYKYIYIYIIYIYIYIYICVCMCVHIIVNEMSVYVILLLTKPHGIKHFYNDIKSQLTFILTFELPVFGFL